MLFALQISRLLLQDVGRHSLYLSITLLGRTAWLQYWPRPIPGRRVLTVGTRRRRP